jgi:hypothetical protein
MAGWLDNFGKEENYNDSKAHASEDFQGEGFSNVGRNSSPAWGGAFQMGGSIPGSVGFTYARTKGIPSEGPYAKKIMPSAKDGGWLDGYKEGGVIKDDRGQWNHPGEITEIGSNEITMEGVPYDVLGISDEGDTKLMKPGKHYKFKGKKVTEFPMAKNGIRQEQKGLQNLEDLTNFTNYNKPTNWLNKYK